MTETAHSLPTDPQALAEAAADAMFERDHAAHALGMQIVHVGPSSALLRMTVRQDMVNGHQICHGGMIFALADTAFAYACNSGNLATVASACQIDFIAPARRDETLEAEACERVTAGRTGIFDVTVRTSEGRVVALFRGKSHRIGGPVISAE